MKYHEPALLDESVSGLAIERGGIYVDVTFGGGGHSREILKHIGEGKLFVFDQDKDAEKNKIDDKRVTMIRNSFIYLKKFLKYFGAIPVNGILADLGVSSHQFDIPERGFSTRFDSGLDMRMNVDAELTAKMVINNYPPEKLQKIFSEYGELKNSRKLAQLVSERRAGSPINTVSQLRESIRECITPGKENKYLAQVFQAIRIEVNDEINALKQLLLQSAEVLKTGGRLVIISYHSLEDRMVKNFFSMGKFKGELQKDIYGNIEQLPFRALTRKPVEASSQELKRNPRVRSAKMRIAVKI